MDQIKTKNTFENQFQKKKGKEITRVYKTKTTHCLYYVKYM